MEIKWIESIENREIMKLNEKENVTYLSYEKYDALPWLVHGFSTRLGGVSEGVCSSMNLSFTRGDKPEAVLENYKRISKAIGFSYESVVTSDQTHTTNIQVVTRKDCGCGVIYPRKFHDIDGMITNDPGIVLATFYADCVPLFLVDTKKRVIGLSHSGWRGTVGKIGKITIEKMNQTYGCQPQDIQVGIGPSICKECYEVSSDVIDEFKNSFDEIYWNELFYQKTEEKYQLDLWAANRIVFREAGILDENIAMPGICTCCNPEFLFSHRASHGKRGNLAAFLGIK